MGKLTLLGISGFGIALFGGALISDASSNTNVNLNRISPVVRSVPAAIGTTTRAASNLLASVADSSAGNDLSNLLHVGERVYDVEFGSSVSSEVLGNAQIQKIGFGKESWVSVITTPTGTYSTDGLASNNVLYPDVLVNEVFDDGRLERASESLYSSYRGSIICVVGSSFLYCN